MKPMILMFLMAVAAGSQTLPPVVPAIQPGDCFVMTGTGTLQRTSTGEAQRTPCGKAQSIVGTVITAVPHHHSSGNSASSAAFAPANEVVMQALEYGKTYDGKAVSIRILPQNDLIKGFLMAVQSKTGADFAIIEVLYRAKEMIGNREVRLFHTKTQVVHLLENMPMLADEVNLELRDVEKINVRLVSESNVVEFWSDTAEIKRK